MQRFKVTQLNIMNVQRKIRGKQLIKAKTFPYFTRWCLQLEYHNFGFIKYQVEYHNFGFKNDRLLTQM